jgi:hypothetical protein
MVEEFAIGHEIDAIDTTPFREPVQQRQHSMASQPGFASREPNGTAPVPGVKCGFEAIGNFKELLIIKFAVGFVAHVVTVVTTTVTAFGNMPLEVELGVDRRFFGANLP